MRKLVIFGAGGFGQEAAWVAESMNAHLPPDEAWEVLGYIDDNPKLACRAFYGYPVLGEAPEARELWFHCALGNNGTREAVAAKLEARGWRPATLVHPSVVRAKDVAIGDGTYVGALSVLSPNARIGRHVLINQRVAIGHDAVLEDFSQACPGAQINGSCKLERGAFVGSNASLSQGRKVGRGGVLGANSTAIIDVAPGATVIGVPARVVAIAE